MNRSTIRKFWLEPGLIITGAEDPPADDNADDQDDANDDAGGEGDGKGSDDSDDEDDDSDEEEMIPKSKVEALKKALREERAARKAAQRDAKAKTKAKDDADAKDKADESAEALKAAQDKADKLARGYLNDRVERTIAKVAATFNVVSTDDVVALLKAQGYDGIDIDQDEDDPTKVEVDEDDVKSVIKRALKTRQHWIKKADEDDDAEEKPRSGSKMVPKGQRKKGLDDAQLKEDYPALRMRR